jgi:hypothetical protein
VKGEAGDLYQGETDMAAALRIGKWLVIADVAGGVMINFGLAMGWIDPVAIILMFT